MGNVYIMFFSAFDESFIMSRGTRNDYVTLFFFHCWGSAVILGLVFKAKTSQ